MTLRNDIRGSRQTIEFITSRISIYFTRSMAGLGGVLFLIGLFCSLGPLEEALKTVPGYLILLVLGIVAFLLFFPWFMVLYVSRHFLLSISTLETRVARLEALPPPGIEESPSM